jgi:cell division GTPase FtsZ
MIEDSANATFFLPLNKLVGDVDNMNEAMTLAVDTLASAVTLFWRLVEKPGYIRLDAERIRHLLSRAGRGRFAAVTSQGNNRAADIVDKLTRAPMLTAGTGPVRAILCGVLAGEDLRLSEIATISNGIQNSFGGKCTLELATVNDEATFSGRLAVVALLFDKNAIRASAERTSRTGASRQRKARSVLHQGHEAPFGKGEPTLWEGKEIDTPTYLRRNIALEP